MTDDIRAVGDPEAGDLAVGDLPAGDFSTWLGDIGPAIRGERSSEPAPAGTGEGSA